MKVNPRRIPKTEADVIKAHEKGFKDGISGGLTIMLYCLYDKFAYSDEQLKTFADMYNYTIDSINKGYVKESDLQKVIKEEYGLTIELK